MTTDIASSAIHTFLSKKPNRALAYTTLIVGAIGLPVCLLVLLTGSGGVVIPLVGASMCLFMGLQQVKRPQVPIFEVHANHLQFAYAPNSKVVQLSLADIASIDADEQLVMFKLTSGKNKNYPMSAVTPEQRSELVNVLNSLFPANKHAG